MILNFSLPEVLQEKIDNHQIWSTKTYPNIQKALSQNIREYNLSQLFWRIIWWCHQNVEIIYIMIQPLWFSNWCPLYKIIYVKLVQRQIYLHSYFIELGLERAIKINYVRAMKLGNAGEFIFLVYINFLLLILNKKANIYLVIKLLK